MSKNKPENSHICPWWLIWTFDNPIRRMLHHPEEILAELVKSGDVVLDLGCGAGFFSVSLARLAGPEGRVIAVDLQPEMLSKVKQRAQKAGVQVLTHQAQPNQIDLAEQVDFALAFWMVHEVPNQHEFLSQVYQVLKPASSLLVAEPKLHVSEKAFNKMCETAQKIGFQLQPPPKIRFSRAVLLQK